MPSADATVKNMQSWDGKKKVLKETIIESKKETGECHDVVLIWLMGLPVNDGKVDNLGLCEDWVHWKDINQADDSVLQEVENFCQCVWMKNSWQVTELVKL